MEKVICVFGDSTAWGAWDDKLGGWVQRLWLYMAGKEEGDQTYVEILNCSLAGGTTDDILERFENEAKVRKADILIFQTGGNDAAEDSKGNLNIPLEKFENNLEEIVSRASSIAETVIFMGFKNVDESRSLPVSWDDFYYRNSNVEKYDNVMKKVCENHSLLYIEPPYLEKTDFADGVHPNSSGHEKIFETVQEFLMKNNIIK